ncbi:alpha/beta fold hydrolase [Planomonospora parontospora]|uniref:alpha/beta fold hydrolase n=1 Tax=Planomonospora parontospora TaxID=58119 RepID=UPI0016704901|nr:alpha/beta hydrolase [Planomonospora parontospora]GGL46747.1 alpha/beta hydrolase [Planomonospora parontospora subsp. antibiotica]GII19424.1 alpha/beta hydrolase [Planomonospora parontospora subsp. antibiotica]
MNTVTSQDGTTIAYDTIGSGPSLILVGGAFQVRRDPRFADLAAALAAHFTVLTYDRRGRGDSGDTGPYAPAREVEDIVALIKEAGGRAHLFGMSSGAALALDAAAAETAVTKVAVYEAPFVVDDSRPPVPAGYLAELKSLLADGRTGDAAALFLTTAAGVPAEFVEGMRSAPFWADMEAVAHTLAYDGEVMGDTMSGRPLPGGRWADVTAPVLVIDGGASGPWMSGAANALAAVLPGASRATLDGQDHDVSPAALAPVLQRFYI